MQARVMSDFLNNITSIYLRLWIPTAETKRTDWMCCDTALKGFFYTSATPPQRDPPPTPRPGPRVERLGGKGPPDGFAPGGPFQRSNAVRFVGELCGATQPILRAACFA